jgi:hypothetical protein
MLDGRECAASVPLVNRKVLEYTEGEPRGIFCETFIPVGDNTVLNFRYSVAGDVYVKV